MNTERSGKAGKKVRDGLEGMAGSGLTVCRGTTILPLISSVSVTYFLFIVNKFLKFEFGDCR